MGKVGENTGGFGRHTDHEPVSVQLHVYREVEEGAAGFLPTCEVDSSEQDVRRGLQPKTHPIGPDRIGGVHRVFEEASPLFDAEARVVRTQGAGNGDSHGSAMQRLLRIRVAGRE